MRKFLIKEVTDDDWIKADMPIDRCSNVIDEDELQDRLDRIMSNPDP